MTSSPTPISRRHWLLRQAALLGSASGASRLCRAAADATGGDPLGSMQWPSVRDTFMGAAANYRFSPAVVVHGPPFAEDAGAVALMVDARGVAALGQRIERVEVVIDRNPIAHVLSFYPDRIVPVLAFRVRMEQASPVRALVRSDRGQWWVGQTWVDAAGGGCTVPGATRKDGSWVRTLNQIQSKLFASALEVGGLRLRLRIMHPMDTGLVGGIPSFHLQDLVLRDDAEQPLARLQLHEPVAENPMLTFELGTQVHGSVHLSGRDNNGNTFFQQVRR